MNAVLIFGATSAIAVEAAKRFAADGVALALCGRDEAELNRLAADLRVRGADCEIFLFESTDSGSIRAATSAAFEKYPNLDGVLIAHGWLPAESELSTDPEIVSRAVTVNMTSAIAAAGLAAARFQERRTGVIAAISSVAADRGRAKNFAYGAAKSGLATWLSGLRQSLFRDGVRVVTIKPGFVDTPMTEGMPKGLLFASAEQVGHGVYKAMLRSRGTVYLPGYWRWIMLIVRLLPDFLFDRTRF